MRFDVFFSISQTPVDGKAPAEQQMLRNFLQQVEAADRLGFGVAWIAEAHLSTEVQKRNRKPVVPDWKGEVGLNTDILQLAHVVLQRTGSIEVGSAVLNLLCNGGPVAHAERIATFAALRQAAAPGDNRRLHVGFSAGRFDFQNRAYGIDPRPGIEQAMPFGLWKGKVFDEAAEIFARLLRGDTLSSADIKERTVTRADGRTDDDWRRIQQVARQEGRLSADGGTVRLPKWYEFEHLKLVPQDWDRSLVQLVVGSHDPAVQANVNRILPAHVANLSITPSTTIEATHERMRKQFHPAGGAWKREHMPRTVLVFLNEEPGLTKAERQAAAKKEARSALSAYWSALEGTLDPRKVDEAADNAVVGDAEDVAAQLASRYHPDDRLMLWFDFFNHDCARVVRNMEAFMQKVAPLLPRAKAVAA